MFSGVNCGKLKKLGREGIVAKRHGSLYLPGKTSDAWQKHRFNEEGVFVIGGYVRGGSNFSSLNHLTGVRAR
jgi:ATP-dependent DNA ligase